MTVTPEELEQERQRAIRRATSAIATLYTLHRLDREDILAITAEALDEVDRQRAVREARNDDQQTAGSTPGPGLTALLNATGVPYPRN